ncbi:MAG: hypothetical protein LUM44_18645 [Pyrinomonadaceae bacterium]|nr:hypothetical protein [Pyrinomonadaceae bacterium]
MILEKLSPNLALIAYEFDQREKTGIMQPFPENRPQGILTREITETTEILVFVYLEQDSGLTPPEGVHFYSDTGKIRTACVRLSSLGNLTDLPEVKYISSSVRLKPLNDSAVIETKLNQLLANNTGLQDSGVVIGIISSEIDSAQAVFRGRFHSIWDQTNAGGNGWNEQKNYGKILTDDELGAITVSGSQIPGIIGAAVSFNARFNSIENNRIVAVKSNLQSARIADAIHYVFEIARQLGKPAVIILGVEKRLTEPAETDDLSKFVALETGSDFVINHTEIQTEGIGNKTVPVPRVIRAIGEDNMRFSEDVEISIKLPKTPANQRGLMQFVVRGWFEEGGRCEIVIKSPDGGSKSTGRPSTLEPNTIQHTTYDNSKVFLTVPAVSKIAPERKEFFIDVRSLDNQKPITAGTWNLLYKNYGTTPVNISVIAWVPEGENDLECH